MYIRESVDAKWLGALRQAMNNRSSCSAMETLLLEASGAVSRGIPAEGTTQRASPSDGVHVLGAQPSTIRAEKNKDMRKKWGTL